MILAKKTNVRSKRKILLLLFFLLSTPSIASASWDNEGWKVTQESELTSYYCDEGIKFYREGAYEKAREAFKKALLIDSECEIAREYLRKLKVESLKLKVEEEFPLTAHRTVSGIATTVAHTKPLTQLREDKIEKEIKEIEKEIERMQVTSQRVAGCGLRKTGKDRKEETEGWMEYKSPLPVTCYPSFSISEKQKAVVEALNEFIEPVKISGEYRMGLGVYSGGEVEWKKADADLQEDSWRYLYGSQRFNTFDPVVYNRLKLDIEAPLSENWNLGMKLVIDPWSFVGKTQKFRVYNSDSSDYADIQLKYWSNLDTTILQTVRTHKGNVINVPEIKVEDGKIVSTSISAARSDELQKGWNDSFGTISDYKISREFKPIRNLWVEYKTDEWRMKVFPFGGQEEALTSDDPLGLSNHHIYWEPSPWLDYWEPGENYTTTGWEGGEWKKDWYAEDSEHQWLRRLRGINFAFGNEEYDEFSLETTVATPLGVWDDYSELNALLMALRAKYRLSEEWQLGTTQTGQFGYDEGSMDAWAWAGGLDLQYKPYQFEDTTIKAEIAHSKKEQNILTSAHKEEKSDNAYKIELSSKIPTLLPNYYYEDIPLDVNLSFTRIDKYFFSPLASYCYTRDDRPWGRYLSFFPRSPQDEVVRLGDSVDVNREVYGITLRSKLFDERIRPLFNYRNAHRVSDGKFIEAIYRGELEYDILENLRSKLMYIYDDRPDDSSGRSTSTDRAAAGLRYEFADWLAAETIYTHTNEYPSFPDDIYTYVNANPDPPYPYYNIYKGRIIYQPFSELTLTLDHTTNEFKFANRIADAYYYDELSYDGLEIKYEPTSRLTTRLVYRYSQVANLNQYVDNGDEDVERHHNFYGELNYRLDPDAELTLQYGDLGIYLHGGYIPFTHAVLDTQHLFRIFYTQRF
ncbi:MAG: hypothetical protein B5M48_01605 [Candidatus Omnitrophica bacterium 4484_213]|nr:MAG: hypothetical protein B5M48_01605 [Candidatus Omnitrophica bacterium 4484_213]